MPESPLKRRAGCLVPLFSVYSEESSGIGDLNDLKLLTDWAVASGNSILQFLPMNEMGPFFCPYDALSSFALEPAYMHIGAKGFRPNKLVNYSLKGRKIEAARKKFSTCNLNAPGLREFRQRNSYWLKDFTLYKAIKQANSSRPWYEWPQELADRQPQALEAFARSREAELDFQAWLQWQLFEQFKEAAKYAAKKKVLFKGDLPILVSRDSADVWAHREYFKLDLAAGAPPDMYCAKGQRWGMPTYDWERIEADGFTYLKEKLKYAENFYDILRVDHVVGLFRIWSIPYADKLENQGLNGAFDPADESRWAPQGRKILQLMRQNTGMQLCAEDLGIIPVACPEALREFAIPGNDVQRWAKDWNTRHDFLAPDEYRELSVAMLSTHDTTNWPAWWENEAGTVDEALFIRKCSDHRKIDFTAVKDKLFDPERSRHGRLRWREDVSSVEKLVEILGRAKEELGDFIDLYLNTYQEKEKLWARLGLIGSMREKCDQGIVRKAFKAVLDSSSAFCVNTIFDYLYLSDILKGDPCQYRINTPGTISDKNWSITVPLSLEELIEHKITKDIRKLIENSGRI